MSNNFVSNKEKEIITEGFVNEYDDKSKQIEQLFASMQKQEEDDIKDNIEKDEKAMSKFAEIFKPKTFTLDIEGVTFFFKYNLSIYEYEQLKNLEKDDIHGKLRFFHTLVVEPKVSYDMFKDLPAEYIAYAEQKIYDFFLQKLTKVK